MIPIRNSKRTRSARYLASVIFLLLLAGCASPAATPEHTYTIVRGDNFSMVASKFNISVRAIEEANPGVDSARLRIGQVLVIPAVPPLSGAASVPVAPEQK